MAVFNERTNSATCFTISGFCLCASICFTIALPTITPSAMAATLAASSGVATPKPTATGRWVTFLIFSTFLPTSAKLRQFCPGDPGQRNIIDEAL